jgi:hypothetical protein
MQQQEYIVRIAKEAEKDVAKWLHVPEAPQYVRVSTIAPLSNWGYPPGTEGFVLRISDQGLVMGCEGRNDVPHDFVPWQNIAYISDGTELVKQQQAKAQQNAALANAAKSAEIAALPKPKNK